MKKIFTILALATLFVACSQPQPSNSSANTIQSPQPAGLRFDYGPTDEYRIQEIDSCEYIIVNALANKDVALTHKGNCKYCAQRQRALLIEILDK